MKRYFIFFQKNLLSKASKENMPTKYANKSKKIPKTSTENSKKKKLFFIIVGVMVYWLNTL